MTRTDEDIRNAYFAWENGMDWPSVASVHGYPTAEAAMMSVRRYASMNKLPLRRATPVPNHERRKLSYCAYLLGWSWVDIAREYGWSCGGSAQKSVTEYARKYRLALQRLP